MAPFRASASPRRRLPLLLPAADLHTLLAIAAVISPIIVNRATCARSDCTVCSAYSVRLRSVISIVVARNIGGLDLAPDIFFTHRYEPNRPAVFASVLFHNIVVLPLSLLELREQRSGSLAIFFEAEVQERELSKLLLGVVEHGLKRRIGRQETKILINQVKCLRVRFSILNAIAPHSSEVPPQRVCVSAPAR